MLRFIPVLQFVYYSIFDSLSCLLTYFNKNMSSCFSKQLRSSVAGRLSVLTDVYDVRNDEFSKFMMPRSAPFQLPRSEAGKLH